MTNLQRQMVSLAVLFPGISVDRAAEVLGVRPSTTAAVAWSLRRMLDVDDFTRNIHPAPWLLA